MFFYHFEWNAFEPARREPVDKIMFRKSMNSLIRGRIILSNFHVLHTLR